MLPFAKGVISCLSSSPPPSSFPSSRTLTTTSSPWWTPGIASTPTTSLNATAMQTLLREKWSGKRSHGGGATSPSLGSRLLTGCYEMYKHNLDRKRNTQGDLTDEWIHLCFWTCSCSSWETETSEPKQIISACWKDGNRILKLPLRLFAAASILF